MDYKKIGFKCGLEIHQQLDVGKLFCRCPSLLRKDKPDFKVNRKLRAMAGETGKIDKAAAHAQSKRLSYIYEGYDRTTCQVELDEEPPRKINQKALEAALTMAEMLNCKIPDYLQIMRKTVVDGSNTSAFQRTVLIGTDGYLKTEQGKVQIENISLEEDSARRTAEDKKSVTYRLDRLGIPLIEIGTGPDVKNPEHAKETALKIGMLLRATGRAMRGIGTIRQDVNVSIKNHPRVELKGFQNLKAMPGTIINEVNRQKKESKKKGNPKPHVRNVKKDLFSKYLRPISGEDRMYPETDLRTIEITKEHLKEVKKNLPEFPNNQIKKLKERGLSESLASQVLFNKKFQKLSEKFPKFDPTLIATTLLSTQKEIRKKLKQERGEFELKHFEEIFTLLKKEKISKESIPKILEKIAEGEETKKAEEEFELLSKKQLKKEIKKLKKRFKKAPERKLKGIVIGKLKSRAKIQDIVKNI